MNIEIILLNQLYYQDIPTLRENADRETWEMWRINIYKWFRRFTEEKVDVLERYVVSMAELGSPNYNFNQMIENWAKLIDGNHPVNDHPGT